jgi:hypothetical protein
MQFIEEDIYEERSLRNEEQVFQHKERVQRLAAKRKKFADSRVNVGDVDSDEFYKNAHTRAISHKARKFEFENADNFTADDIVSIYKEQEGCCFSCFANLGDTFYEVDHKNPVQSAGNNSKSNIQLLCFSCNRSKNNKDFHKWISSIRYEQVTDYLTVLSEEGY